MITWKGADLEIELKVLAWLGNQLRPESLFQKDLDIDPFIASTPEAIQAEYEDMQVPFYSVELISHLQLYYASADIWLKCNFWNLAYAIFSKFTEQKIG